MLHDLHNSEILEPPHFRALTMSRAVWEALSHGFPFMILTMVSDSSEACSTLLVDHKLPKAEAGISWLSATPPALGEYSLWHPEALSGVH